MKKNSDQASSNRNIKLPSLKKENRPIQKVEPVYPTTKNVNKNEKKISKIDTKVSRVIN